jgi:formylglycine-generating enzyme required for sulfatase activity
MRSGGLAMLRRLLAFCLVLATATLLAVGARAERRVALVVGNAAYEGGAALRTTRDDAKDMAEALKKSGFEIVLGLDLDQDHFASTLETFARALDGAAIGLFFYAGHGLQIDERNYLVSVNAQLGSEFLISSETIALDAVVRLMESKVATSIVLLDASRNNPLTENLKRSLAAMRRSATLGKGLAPFEPASRDTMIAYAAGPGQEAADGGDRNSPFAAALLKRIAEPGLEISVMLKQVAADVREATRDKQRPQQLGDMSRRIYFVPATPAAAVPDSRPAPAAAPPAVQSAEDRSLEIAFWTSARAANECDAMRAYLLRYPTGVFVELAKLSEARLCKPERTVTMVEKVPQAAIPPVPQPAVPEPQAAPPSPPPQTAAPASPPPPQQQITVIKPPAAPATPTPGSSANSFRDCERCPEMVNLPGGQFIMGSNEDPSERPPREVTIAPFALGRYPVTIGEWRQCAADKACGYTPAGDDNLPVHNVSWTDAQEYVAWLSKTTQTKYRLPSEAEWEYAARASTTTRFWWGNSILPGRAACKGCGTDANASLPIKVGAFVPNPLGLHDMTGGVSQWVADCWVRDYQGAPRTGAPRELPNCRQYVLRGGSWKNDPSYMRSASRDHYDAGVRYLTHGFRVARSKGN